MANPDAGTRDDAEQFGRLPVGRRVTAWIAVALVAVATVSSAEDGTAESRAAQLSRDFSDPLTTVPQIFLQDAYTPANYGTDALTNRLTARIIVPRVPKFSLFPFVQLIRPSLSLVTVPTGIGEETRTELGDMQLFDLFVLPRPERETGLYVGIGPVFVFPTATDELAGQGAWQVGPAFASIYKGIPGLLLGTLIQNPISFAYTEDDRPALNTLIVQPIILLHLWHGLYAKSADASWTIGWRNENPRTYPVSFGLGYVFLKEDAPPINVFISGEWTAHRENVRVGAQTTVRFGMTVAVPEWRPW